MYRATSDRDRATSSVLMQMRVDEEPGRMNVSFLVCYVRTVEQFFFFSFCSLICTNVRGARQRDFLVCPEIPRQSIPL